MRRNDPAYDELCRAYEVAVEKRRLEEDIAQNSTATPPPSPQPPASPVIGAFGELNGRVDGNAALALIEREIHELESKLRQREKELLPIYHQVLSNLLGLNKCASANVTIVALSSCIPTMHALLIRNHWKQIVDGE
jgi:hypothetical protein